MKVENDRLLDVAYGNSRTQKKWKNRQTLWSDLLDRLSATTRTSETVAEYERMSRDQQASIKDCGGFVGGVCKDGSRSQVTSRSLLALDADFGDADLWQDWLLLYGNAAAVYSTHKHKPDAQRLRLVVPLARDVSPDEYQAIGRRVAQDLGIDKFDDSTYQPQRVMYWPSTSRDGEYIFDHTDGALLDPDKVLATYKDWRDMSAWPYSSRVADISRKAAEKQQDPLTKDGLVGTFCRTYSIRDAIEKWVPEYAPTDDPNRYTYTEGSTAAGVVVYEDKWTYSNHATDPASGQLLNAWDLVRIHRFGNLDGNVREDTPITKRPSFKAMTDMAVSDDAVKVAIVEERMASADEDFDVISPEDDGWKKKLVITKQGVIAKTIHNVVTILENDERLKGHIRLNAFDQTLVSFGPVPWAGKPEDEMKAWTDTDDSALRYYMERLYGIDSKDKLYDGVNVVANRHSINPVRDYLDGLEWDGEERVDTLLVKYLGAEDSPYTRAVTRKHLCASVARIYRPGVKYDTTLVIRGRQGLGKSTLIGKLGGKWYSDTFTTVQGKEAFEQIQGVWIVEMGELAGLKKAESDQIKLFVSKQTDRFRPAYGRRIGEYPRQCTFWGTTNEAEGFLRDTTGNRRFWIVDTPGEPTASVWEDFTQDEVDQVWAEAVQMFRKGEPLRLPPDLERIAAGIQQDNLEDNPLVGIIQNYLDRLLPSNWESMDQYDRRAWLLDENNAGTVPRTTVSRVEIWAEALGNDPAKLDRIAGRTISGAMAQIPGWRYGDRVYVPGFGRQRVFTKEK